MGEILATILTLIAKMGYFGIVFLMTIESSFIPFPSEVVIPPAAYLASQGKMNIYLVVLFGIIGSLIGAFVNYYLAMTFGRKIVFALARHKLAKFFLINENKISQAEKYFLDYGAASTFVGRLVPAVRQLISLPAGFSRMDIKKFFLFTFLGSGAWIIILAVLGYSFGANQDVLSKYYKIISWSFVLVFIVLLAYFFYKRKKL